jgi:sugar lactone lactonase YvrE
MYYIDSPTQRVMEFAYEPESGAISSPRLALEIPAKEGTPDGLCVDSEGMLWIALFHGSKVIRCDPKQGRRLSQVAVPGVNQVTSCCFGGPQWKTLFITTAKEGFDEALSAAEPLAGSLFSFEVDIPGLPPHAFRPQ